MVLVCVSGFGATQRKQILGFIHILDFFVALLVNGMDWSNVVVVVDFFGLGLWFSL